jgi:hypothetical protein
LPQRSVSCLCGTLAGRIPENRVHHAIKEGTVCNIIYSHGSYFL